MGAATSKGFTAKICLEEAANVRPVTSGDAQLGLYIVYYTEQL